MTSETPPTGADLPEKAPGRWPALLVLAGGLLACIPGVPAAAALTGGAALALTVGNPLSRRTRPLARKLLPAAVIGLGGAMDLAQVARAGVRGVGYTVASIGAALALTWLLGRLLRVDRRTGTLVGVGTAICGGSAIAAAAPVIGADEREMSVALGTVFLLNSVALLVFPPIGHAAGLTQPAFGLWAALAIHDTSSVVGAAIQYGPVATTVATTVKLARALWIVPVTLGLGILERRRGGTAGRRGGNPPWFILGFLAAAAAATFLPALRPAGHLAAAAARQAMVLTLYLIGLGLSRESLRAVGTRPLVLGLVLWIAAAAGTLLAVRLGLAAV
ncbi:MAG TPA: putative sulfate exporter family transporter [Anaeromyxobacter sp.]|nr:putative sulfate exporter family transporter [Anaeromyxobacter sp.]